MSKHRPMPWTYLKSRMNGNEAFIRDANGIILGEVNLDIAPLITAAPRMLELIKRAILMTDNMRMVDLIRLQEVQWLDEAQKLIAEIESGK